MTLERLMLIASAALERQGVHLTDFTETSATVEGGMGVAQKRGEVPLGPLLEWIEAHPDRARAGVVSFLRAVGSVAVAPTPTKREAGMPFAEAAGRLLPSLEGPLYATGARLALRGNEEPFGQPVFGGLYVAHFLELDMGRRLLTRSQVTGWGVSDDRAHKAGISLLFHRTAEEEPAAYALEGVPGCQAFKVGDGYDATRALVLEPLLFQRCRKGLVFAVPACDLLLLLDDPDEDSVLEAFRSHVERLHADSAWPLSEDAFTIERGQPVALSR